VFTSKRKEYREMAAMKTKVNTENKSPPFMKALPRKSTPVPMKDFKSCNKNPSVKEDNNHSRRILTIRTA
jgi:hypothetical protein